MADGLDAIQKLRDGGFSEEEITNYQADQTGKLQSGGFSPDEIKSYWGAPTPKVSSTIDQLHANMDAAPKSEPGGDPKTVAKDDYLGLIKAAYEDSSTGLAVGGLFGKGLPDTVAPEHMSMLGDVVYGAAHLVSDAPAILAGAVGGAIGGAAAGTVEAPVVGTVSGAVVGGAAGGMGLPAYLRAGLMDYYKEGGNSPRPFLTKITDAFLGKHALVEGAKAATVGAVSGVTGGAAGAALEGAGALGTGVALQTAAATATTVNAALEGRMPTGKELAENALFAAAGHGAIEGIKAGIPEAAKRVETYMKDQYADAGEMPHEAAARMANDPIARSDAITYSPDLNNTINPPSGETPMPSKPQQFLADETGTVGKAAGNEPVVGKTDAETNILKTIGERPAKGYDGDDFLNQYVNPLHYAQEAVRTATRDATGTAASKYENSGEYMRLAWGAPAKAERIVQRDLMPLWKEIPKEDRASAMAYLKAKQEADIIGQGLKSALDPKDVQEVIEAGNKNPLFVKTSRALTQYFNTSADKMVEDGLKTPEAVAAMKAKWPNYIPSDRIMGDDFAMPQAGKSFRVYDPVKALEGSNKQTTNAFQAAVRVAQTRTSLGMKTQALQRYAEQSDSLPEENQYFKKVSNDGPLGDNEIQYYEKGQLVRRAAKDPRVVNSLTNMSPPEISLGYKIGQKFSSVLRVGIVASPDFWLQQPLRNEIAGQIVNTKGAFLTDMAKGIKPYLTKDANFDRWVDSGGANHALFAFERDIFNPDYFSLNGQKTLPAQLWNQLKTPLHFLQAAGDVMGNSKSLGQFIRHTAAGMPETEAALRSRDATMDHMIIGTSMRGINAAGAFTAPFVNHLRQFTDMVRDNPAHVATMGATFVTLPTVYLWWANRNQDWYQNTDQLTKDRNWLIRVGGTDINPQIAKIKRPYIAGELFGALPERILNAYADHNPDAWDHIGRSLVDSVIPWKEAIPVWMRGPAEVMTNYNLTNEAPLVSQNMEKNALPQYRMTPYTSATAKAVAKVAPEFLPDRFRTPIAIDHLTNAWSGQMGQYVTQLIDQGMYASGLAARPVRPTPELSDMPFVKSFFLRYPSANMAPVQKFYELADKSGQTVRSYQTLIQQGKEDEAESLIQGDQQLRKMAKPLKAMGLINKAIRGIQADNENYTPDEKRQFIDNYMQQLLAIAKQGVENMRPQNGD